MPLPKLPPPHVVPYRVLLNNINPPYGLLPSPAGPAKLCKFVKSVPSVLTANTMPLTKLPPFAVVPNSVPPDLIKPALGLNPSLPMPVKVCRFVKPVPSVLTANTVPPFSLPPAYVVPYSVLPDKINPAYGVAPSVFVKKPERFG